MTPGKSGARVPTRAPRPTPSHSEHSKTVPGQEEMTAVSHQTSSNHSPQTGKSGQDLPADQPVGRFRVRAGDLVLVDDPHESRPFLAEITGHYVLGRVVMARLGPAPGAQRAPRLSTKARNVRKAWRLAGRAKIS